MHKFGWNVQRFLELFWLQLTWMQLKELLRIKSISLQCRCNSERNCYRILPKYVVVDYRYVCVIRNVVRRQKIAFYRRCRQNPCEPPSWVRKQQSHATLCDLLQSNLLLLLHLCRSHLNWRVLQTQLRAWLQQTLGKRHVQLQRRVSSTSRSDRNPENDSALKEFTNLKHSKWFLESTSEDLLKRSVKNVKSVPANILIDIYIYIFQCKLLFLSKLNRSLGSSGISLTISSAYCVMCLLRCVKVEQASYFYAWTVFFQLLTASSVSTSSIFYSACLRRSSLEGCLNNIEIYTLLKLQFYANDKSSTINLNLKDLEKCIQHIVSYQ